MRPGYREGSGKDAGPGRELQGGREEFENLPPLFGGLGLGLRTTVLKAKNLGLGVKDLVPDT